MTKPVHTIPITQIILDEEIYPRSGVYPKRVSMFAENIRDGFKIDPIEVQIHPEYSDKYRILDGAHRWHAYKEIGATDIPVHIITLDGVDPLLYAAKKAIGPLQLNEEEARNTARRAYQNNPRLTSLGDRTFKAGSRLLYCRFKSDIPDGRGSEDITNEPASYPTGANGEPGWCTTTDYFYLFTKNARIGKTCKYRFIERFHCSPGC